jgi:hypothetical protein
MPAMAERSIVEGTVLRQTLVEGVAVPCPEGAICMSSWYAYDLAISRTSCGPQLPREIRVVNLAHGQNTSSSLAKFKFFKLVPIDSRATRALLNADYYLDQRAAEAAKVCPVVGEAKIDSCSMWCQGNVDKTLEGKAS